MRAANKTFDVDEEEDTTPEATPVDENEHLNEPWEEREGTVRDILTMDPSTLKELIDSTARPPADEDMHKRHRTVTSPFLSYGNFTEKDLQIILLMNRRHMLLERMLVKPGEADLTRELANAEINMMTHIGATKAMKHVEREALVTHITANKSISKEESAPVKKKGWLG